MDSFSLIGAVTGLGNPSGLSLYLTDLLTGLVVRFNFLSPRQNRVHLHGLDFQF